MAKPKKKFVPYDERGPRRTWPHEGGKGGRPTKENALRIKEETVKALVDSKGFVTVAAEKLKISHQSLYERIKRCPDLQAIHAEIIDKKLDLLEIKLYELVGRGNLGAIIFGLKCQGKHRGWNEKPSIDVNLNPGAGNLIIEIVEDRHGPADTV